MAWHTRKEFAVLAGYPDEGTKWKAINVYIKRGNIVCSGELIDDQFHKNKDWLNLTRAKKGLPPFGEDKKSTEVISNPKIEEPKDEPEQAPEVKPIKRSSKNSSDLSIVQLETEIKRADLEKKQQDIKLLKIKEAKMKGELIPTDLVQSLIRELSEAMKIAYMDAIENYTVVISRQKKLTTKEESDIKSHFTRIINDALSRQTAVAKKGLKNIVSEYQEVRSRGEKK